MEEQFGSADLGGPDLSGEDPPAADSPWDEEILAGFDPSGHLDPWEAPDDDWPACLPPDIRAEVESRPPVTGPPFADRGLADEMLPGWRLGELLADATVAGYGALPEDDLAGVLRACGRQIAHYQALQARAVIEVAERRLAASLRPGWSAEADHIADELAAELTLTGRAAHRLAEVAAGLRRLPAVCDALLTGTIDWARACVFADDLAVLDKPAAAEVAEQHVGRAAGWTTGQLRAALARAVLTADPAAAQQRRKLARRDTRVELWHEPSGNAALAGRELAPADVIAAHAQLAADADWAKSNGATGTLAELRASAFIARLTGRDLATQLPPDQPPAQPGREPAPAAGSVHLTMPLSALLGGSQPGEVASYGPADAETSRELARLLARDPATRWCLTLTGPDGQPAAHACARRGPMAGEPMITWAAGLRTRMQVLAYGTCDHARRATGYVPPPRLRHLVMVRQQRCAFPGCRRAAARCDLDHTVPFERGGLTCECNLAPLCRRHHRCKQTPGWRLAQDQPGRMTWHLPSSRTRHTTGEPYLT